MTVYAFYSVGPAGP